MNSISIPINIGLVGPTFALPSRFFFCLGHFRKRMKKGAKAEDVSGAYTFKTNKSLCSFALDS